MEIVEKANQKGTFVYVAVASTQSIAAWSVKGCIGGSIVHFVIRVGEEGVICAADFFLSLWLEQMRNGSFIRKSIAVYGNLAARPQWCFSQPLLWLNCNLHSQFFDTDFFFLSDNL